LPDLQLWFLQIKSAISSTKWAVSCKNGIYIHSTSFKKKNLINSSIYIYIYYSSISQNSIIITNNQTYYHVIWWVLSCISSFCRRNRTINQPSFIHTLSLNNTVTHTRGKLAQSKFYKQLLFPHTAAILSSIPINYCSLQ
jgi:hypothetical protein